MSSEGMLTARLSQLHDAMAGHVERGAVPGIVTLVSWRGDVHIDEIGMTATDGKDPMRHDTIFRISSLTKPLAAVAAMILVEEGMLQLDDPVDRLLPELANRQVLKRLDGPLDETVPANRSITMRDLLTFRLGFGVIMASPDAYPILMAENEHQLMTLGPPKPSTPHTPDEWIRRLGSLPLMHQPGERWMYGTGSHVLGVLIARASGQPLETFLRERIFEPLGMRDTGFSVPPTKLSRLASCYEINPETRALELHDGVGDSHWSQPPVFPDAAGGLVSTIDDYLAFGQMMLNEGRHGSERILSKRSIEAMTTDQITPEQKAVSDFFPGFWDDRGWGLGISIDTRRDGETTASARFGWDGGYGTSWYSDPHEDLTAILMTQCLAGPYSPRIDLDFWTQVYQAINA